MSLAHNQNEEDSLPASAVDGGRSVVARRGTALAGKESVGVICRLGFLAMASARIPKPRAAERENCGGVRTGRMRLGFGGRAADVAGDESAGADQQRERACGGESCCRNEKLGTDAQSLRKRQSQSEGVSESLAGSRRYTTPRPSRRGDLDAGGKSIVQTLHRVSGPANRRRPSLGVQPPSRHGESNPRTELVVETYQVEFNSEIGLDGLTLAVQNVERGLVLLGPVSVNLRLHSSPMPQNHVIPLGSVSSCAARVHAVRPRPCIQGRGILRMDNKLASRQGTPRLCPLGRSLPTRPSSARR